MTASDPTSGRHAIQVEGFAHRNPIPAACRIGPLLISSMVVGYDHDTTSVPASPTAQVSNVFAHAASILGAGGATWDDVIRMTFYVPDLQQRSAINQAWLAQFPDPATRPARVTHQTDSELGIRAELVAYVTTGDLA